MAAQFPVIDLRAFGRPSFTNVGGQVPAKRGPPTLRKSANGGQMTSSVRIVCSAAIRYQFQHLRSRGHPTLTGRHRAE